MSLAAAIDSLRSEIFAELTEVHDYYAHTKDAWRVVQLSISTGMGISFRNASTGTVTNERDLPAIAQNYVTGHLSSATFQHFVSLFEDFIFGVMRLWLLEFPQSLSDRKVAGSIILAAPDLDAVKNALVDSKLNDLRYKNVRDWFPELNKMVNLACPTTDEIDQIAEIKASRDVLVHNRGLANQTYEQKAGNRKRYRSGERIEIHEQYHRESWELVRKVVNDISDAAIAKAPS